MNKSMKRTHIVQDLQNLEEDLGYKPGRLLTLRGTFYGLRAGAFPSQERWSASGDIRFALFRNFLALKTGKSTVALEAQNKSFQLNTQPRGSFYRKAKQAPSREGVVEPK
ncbi:hypothetical protein ACLOJK_031773 [Asimina triloba]